MITTLLRYTTEPYLRNFDPNLSCAYHSIVQGHSTKDCHSFKRQKEKTIQDKLIIMHNIDSGERSSHTNMKTNG